MSATFRIRNYMEDVVSATTDIILKQMDVCKCEKCRADIIAIALNNLPPKYVVTEMGQLYAKVKELEQQFAVDVQSAVVKAALIVKDNPKH
ncbi:MAG TPA: late competence development ComFB family protein [Clostridia bacterium]|nr:late competence development ComFB family protein [Clostridia bacterium]